MKARLIYLAVIIAVLVLGASGTWAGESVVVRLDLSQRNDFNSFCDFETKPFFRRGNVFFAELRGEELSKVRRLGIPVEVIDDQPFSGSYYFGTAEAIVSCKIPAPDLENLADVDDHTLYKTATPLDRSLYRRPGFEPIEVIRQEIPLVYFPVSSGAPDGGASATTAVLDSLIGEVSQDSVYAYNKRLEDFQTRFTFADSNLASRVWLAQKLAQFGYTDITSQEFWAPAYLHPYSGWAYNVICVKPGTEEPDKYVIVSGHNDATIQDGTDPLVFCPGADDDGSGTAGTLEIARVLAGTPTRKSIIFILFGGEEQYIVGSRYYAGLASAAGMDIELMLNLDMIGHTGGNGPEVYCYGYPSSIAYAHLMASMADEYTWLYPYASPNAPAADQLAFYENGYPALFAEEFYFNTIGYHTALDITSRMDFPYATEVTKMALGTVYAVSNFPSVINDAVAWDVGDGQSLQVDWTPSAATDIAGYQAYWGVSSLSYTDSVFIAGGTTASATINGLVENQLYYLTMIAVDDSGNQSFLRPEFSGTPRLVPLAPTGLTAETEEWQIALDWSTNQELDFAFYRIYRAPEGEAYALLVDNLTDPLHTDTDVAAGVTYDYAVTAVDVDLRESVYSEVASAAAATFDQGILIVDQTPSGGGNPTAEEKAAFYAAAFAGLETSYYYYAPTETELNKSIIGQYEALFWIDDGNAAGIWPVADLTRLRWYLQHNTAVFLAGWRMAFEFADLSAYQPLAPGNLLYDYTGVTLLEEIQQVDLLGGLGESGFADVGFDPDKVFPSWNGKMGWNGVMEVGGGTGIIYRYDSYSGDNTGRIIGVRRENVTNKFAFVSLPFYYLHDADAQSLISDIATWFGAPPTCNCLNFGDCTDDGAINPVDVVVMVNHVYRNNDARRLLPACPRENGDWDCDGTVNPVDVVYFVNYVYQNLGGGPCDPCAPSVLRSGKL